jgi:hypothetical protein
MLIVRLMYSLLFTQLNKKSLKVNTFRLPLATHGTILQVTPCSIFYIMHGRSANAQHQYTRRLRNNPLSLERISMQHQCDQLNQRGLEWGTKSIKYVYITGYK